MMIVVFMIDDIQLMMCDVSRINVQIMHMKPSIVPFKKHAAPHGVLARFFVFSFF